MATITKIHEISVLGYSQGTSDKVYGLALVQYATSSMPYGLVSFYGPRTGPKALVTATERYYGLSVASSALQTTRQSKFRKGYRVINWSDFAYAKVQNYIKENLTPAGATVAHVSGVKEQLSPPSPHVVPASGATQPRVKPATPPKPKSEPVIERGPREIDL